MIQVNNFDEFCKLYKESPESVWEISKADLVGLLVEIVEEKGGGVQDELPEHNMHFKNILQMICEKRERLHREAFLRMGVPECLVCVEKIEELKKYLDDHDLHFQCIVPEPFSNRGEYIVCVRNNTIEYLKEIDA